LSMAWEKWQYEAAEAKRLRKLTGGAVRRMLHRQLSMAWEKWQYEATEMKRQQAMLDRARRLRNAKMFAAWNMLRAWAVAEERSKAAELAREVTCQLSFEQGGLDGHTCPARMSSILFPPPRRISSPRYDIDVS
jgi:hypothetical protein